ncbi:MAG: hypothetical protein J6A56_04995 [Clostridia bacterium]|nr:hypothetical protein [Clostridia bacterium]
MSQKPKKKKGKMIALIVILVFAVGIGILAWVQANNLKALRLFRYTQEERQNLLNQNEEAIHAMLETLPVEPLSPLTEEQEAMLQRGEITEEEALQMIMGNLVGKKPETETPSKTVVKNEDNKKLQELLARVYLLRSTFTGKLDGLVGEAKSEYIAQKKATGKADKVTIGSRYISKGLALESECDGQMEALLGEIEAELARSGGDTSIISQIRSVYNNEKSIKKANLLSRYAK